MYLLSGQSLTKADWFRPESMGLNLEERKSTASVTIGPEAPAIAVGAWLLDETEPGAGIVWRAKTTETQYNTKTRTVQLEHIVNTLKDVVMFGEIGPKEITGNSGATTCTAWQAISYILGKTSLWTISDEDWDNDYNGISNPYTFNGEDLLSAIETVLSSLEDSYLDFDLTALPFHLKVKKLSSTVKSEMRMSRNIQTLRKVIDRSRMYTRFYPIGENDLHIDGDYVSANENLYGTICKIETDSSKKTKAELLRWANERLSRHCEPSVTVTVSGLELSEATGESLDHIRINRLCQVPLPEFGTVITERVTKVSWSDKIREPEKVTVTLANQLEDVASIVNKLNKNASSSSKAKAKKDKEDHAWFVDTEDHVGMVAEAIIGHGPDGVDWSRVASLIVDGDGIHGRVTRAEGYMVTLAAEMDLSEERLKIGFENAINSTRSEFRMTSESLRIAFENGISCTRSEFKMTAESLRIGFENDISSTRSEFQMTSESLRIAFENGLSSARSEFQMTAESLRVSFESDITSTRSYIQETANTISAVVEGTGANAKLKKAQICLSINGSGGSSAYVDASKITLGSATQGGTQVSIADVMTVQNAGVNGGVAVRKKAVFQDAVYVYNHNLDAGNLINLEYALVSADVVNGSSSLEISDAQGNKTTIAVSGNSLVFTDKDNHTFSFSKATALSEAWDSGNFPLTVNATQTNGGTTTNVGHKSVGFTNASDIYLEIDKNGTPAQYGSSKKYINVPYKVTHHAAQPVGDQVRYTGSIAAVDASSVYNFGFDDVTLSDPDWQYPAANHNSDNTTASNSVIIAASNKTNGTERKKTIAIGLYVDATNKQCYVSAGGYKRAVESCAAVYNNGWEDCFDQVKLNYSTNQALGYGGSVTIYPNSKATPTGQATNITTKGITVTAPADNSITGWQNCYDSFDSSGTTATKTLSFGEQAAVTVKQTNKDGSVITRLSRTYTAPSAPSVAITAPSLPQFDDSGSNIKYKLTDEDDLFGYVRGVYNASAGPNSDEKPIQIILRVKEASAGFVSSVYVYDESSWRSSYSDAHRVLRLVKDYPQSGGSTVVNCDHTKIAGNYTFYCTITDNYNGTKTVNLALTVTTGTSLGVQNGKTYILYK